MWSDASLGGHGFSYSFASEEDVQRMCRMSNFQGAYTQVIEEEDVKLLPEVAHPLKRVALPLDQLWWRHVARPGGWLGAYRFGGGEGLHVVG